jgi:hypothetical protein
MLLVLIFSLMALTGCGRIKLRLNINPEKHNISVFESLTLETSTQQYLGILVRPGADDFWQRLAILAKDNGWMFKERSANQIDISGSFSTKDAAQVTTILSKQLSFVAEGYGAGVEKLDTTLIPVAISITKQQDAFYNYYNALCKYDLSVKRINSQLRGASNWPNFVSPPVRVPIEVEVQTPLEVVSCSGKIDSEKQTCTWTVYTDDTGIATVRYRSMKSDVVIGGLVALAASITILALFIYKTRRASKKAMT